MKVGWLLLEARLLSSSSETACSASGSLSDEASRPGAEPISAALRMRVQAGRVPRPIAAVVCTLLGIPLPPPVKRGGEANILPLKPFQWGLI